MGSTMHSHAESISSPKDAADTYLSVRFGGNHPPAADEIATRAYIGQFDSHAELAQAIWAQSTVGIAELWVSRWPLTHIDWDAAGADLLEPLRLGDIVEVAGGHYFSGE